MGDHSTWFNLHPDYDNLQNWAAKYLARDWHGMMFEKDPPFSITHVVISLFILVVLAMGAVVYRKKVAVGAEGRLIPEKKLGTRNIFEMITGLVLSLSEGVMGREKAERFLPLIGTVFFFILFNNIIGLIPGFLPATDTLKTNLALSALIFLMTHVYGVKAHGLAYFKHFFGPVWYLAWLMFPIELISHLARPISLALRLLGNMVADHKVLATFFFLVPLLVPLPFYVLGILVCVVQAVVFTLLSIVYIELAVAHEEH